MKNIYHFLIKFTIISLLSLISLSGKIEAQISKFEKIANEGYSLRFTDSSKCRILQNNALSAAKKYGAKSDEAICYALMALTQKKIGNLKKFSEYSEISYSIALKTKNERAIAYSNWVMGSLRSYTDNKAGTIDFYLKAYHTFEKLKAYQQCAKVGSDISYLFSPASPWQVKKYAYRALYYAEKSGTPESILHARLAVGSYLTDECEKDSKNLILWQNAVRFLKETVNISKRDQVLISSKSNIGVSHINLAALYMRAPASIKEENFVRELEQAEIISKRYGIKNVYRSSLGLHGQYFMMKGQLDTAENLFNKGIAYQLTLSSKDNETLASFYECLKDIAAKRKDFGTYYRYDTLFVKYNQLNFNEKSQMMLQNAEVKFESEKKISRIHQLESENKLQKKNKYLGYSIATVLMVSLILMYISYYYRKKYYKKQADNLRNLQVNSELKVQLLEEEKLENLVLKLSLERRLLQSQMDPHFIFNALGNIQSMILQENKSQAVLYLSKFAKLTRQVLEQSRKEYISVEEEVETLKNYIEMQQLRLNKTFDYHINMDEHIDLQDQIPPLLIQPFVENAVEHGLKPLADSRRGILSIDLRKDKIHNIIICTITDNGIGMKESKKNNTNKNHQSLATEITDERLSILLDKSNFLPVKIIDRISSSAQNGCTVILNIPVI